MDLLVLLESTLTGLGYELVDMERSGKGSLMRVFIDKPGGVLLDDCAAVSNHLSRVLTVENVPYERLEISSPGLDRPLKKERDFVRFAGQKVRVKLRVPQDGQRNFVGVLKQTRAGKVGLDVEGKAVTFDLANLVNQIINALRQQQRDVIDPFITAFVLTGPVTQTNTRLDPVEFGLLSLRPFVELSLRFLNLACRIQCSTKLMMFGSSSKQDSFVSKLVLYEDHFDRCIYHDKTGIGRAQTINVPVDTTISGYLMFYIKHCRPNPDSTTVFQARRGGRWTTASADLKQYLESMGIPCDDICRNGRFVHGSRHLTLAAYAILCRFDIHKIRSYVLLMRHSLAMVEHVYSPFLKLHQSNMAVDEMFALRGLDMPRKTQSCDSFKILSLLPLSGLLQSTFRQLLSTEFHRRQVIPVFRSNDMATQTDPILPGDYERDQTISDTEEDRICRLCDATLSVCGPLGTSSSPFFGRYFLNCRRCFPSAVPNKFSLWYRLGHVPMVQSTSTKPRNMQAIETYISANAPA